MSKELDSLRSEVKELRLAVDPLLKRFASPMAAGWWEVMLNAKVWTKLVFSVTLQPGDCWTFQSAPSGRITVANQNADHGSVQFSWNDTVNSGDVQSGEARVIEPQGWPVEVCNTGTVPLVVTPT